MLQDTRCRYGRTDQARDRSQLPDVLDTGRGVDVELAMAFAEQELDGGKVALFDGEIA